MQWGRQVFLCKKSSTLSAKSVVIGGGGDLSLLFLCRKFSTLSVKSVVIGGVCFGTKSIPYSVYAWGSCFQEVISDVTIFTMSSLFYIEFIPQKSLSSIYSRLNHTQVWDAWWLSMFHKNMCINFITIFFLIFFFNFNIQFLYVHLNLLATNSSTLSCKSC